LIERALRDEGASLHYLPASDYAEADPALVAIVAAALSRVVEPVERGATWTTDAPYRETVQAIEAARARHSLRRNGGCRALRLRSRSREGRSLLRPRHQPDGSDGGFLDHRSRKERR